MTITDQITALLSADPICGGRVTGETVRAIAGLVEQAMPLLRPASTSAPKVCFCKVICGAPRIMGKQAPCLRGFTPGAPIHDTIERGDFGAGEGA